MQDLLKQFKVKDDFFGSYLKLIKNVVIPFQEKIIHDQVDVGEKSQAVGNFELAAQVIETGKCDREFYGMVFQDSDVAKWLEAAAYSLIEYKDDALEQRCDDLIELIGRAQWKDGYLNTYFTVKAPELRWTNLESAHELYCAGHMMEAAVAYFEVTGKRKLLEIMSRMGDHMYERFIVEKIPGYPGHPEVELALFRMYIATNNLKFRELAEHFINVRGVDREYYYNEKLRSNWFPFGNERPMPDLEYLQAHLPVREQTEAVGHAVRAVYLYSAMAEMAQLNKDETLVRACKQLWKNLTERRSYVTGGIGSCYEGEAFTKDYHLPNDTSYTETCAAIGLIFFARRMLEIDVDSQYGDMMEKALYNAVLPGMELDGTKFFYVNPLEVVPGVSGVAKTHKHALPQRPNWFACACCPPNVARLLTSLGRYAAGCIDGVVYSHLFIGGEHTVEGQGKVVVQSTFPYGSKVSYRFVPLKESMTFTLAVRLPIWSSSTILKINGEVVKFEQRKGYAYIKDTFTEKDEIQVEFDISVKMVFANTKLYTDNGKVAIQRGPIIYCAEGIDNSGTILNLSIDPHSGFDEVKSDELGGIVRISANAKKQEWEDSLYSFKKPYYETAKIHMIPYYTWGNRGLTTMRIWIPYC